MASEYGRPFIEGVLVVEFGRRRAVSAAGALLARLGADVVTIERTEDLGNAERAVRMAGKKSIVITAGDAHDRNLLSELITRADILLISSDIDEVEFWDTPRPEGQIVCDITAYGHSGPLAGVADSEALVQARAGVADTMGPREGAPVCIGAPLLDMETAAYAVSAILAARRVARRTGKGQRIDMALYDVGVNALLTFLPLSFTGDRATRNGNRHPTLSPWNSFSAADGFVLICSPTNDQWRRLCEAMSRPDLVKDTRFASTTARMHNVDAIDAEIGAWVASMTVDQCVAIVGAAGIPCGPILRIKDLAREANMQLREAIVPLRQQGDDRVWHVPGGLFRSSNHAARAPSAIPAPDEARLFVTNIICGRPPQNTLVTDDPTLPLKPLDGLRIVEIGMNTVAPLAGRQLGALGADVVKVEPPTGDSNRDNAPLREDGESYVFALSNTDKRGVVLDLKQEKDRRRLSSLLENAIAVLENLKPGSLKRLGVGASEVTTEHPKLIYCSVSGFGHYSTFPGRPALDTVIQGMSGVMDATVINGIPTKAGISISDQLGGQFGLIALLAAIERRETTGEGCVLDLAMQDCSAWATQFLWNDAESVSEADILQCADGWIAAECRSESAVPDITGMSRSAAVRSMLDMGHKAAPVLNVDEVLAAEQTFARELLLECPSVDGDSWTVLGTPLKLLGSKAVTRMAMPRLGYVYPDLAAEMNAPGKENSAEPKGAKTHA